MAEVFYVTIVLVAIIAFAWVWGSGGADDRE
jgi:nitrogen fixation-related uncharacterized protein